MKTVSRVDILGGKNVECADCGNLYGIHFGLDGGICVDPLCFACLMKYLDSINAVIG